MMKYTDLLLCLSLMICLLSGCGNTAVPPVLSDYAAAHGIPLSAYPDSLVQLLERNPETEAFVLHYPEYPRPRQEPDRFDRSQGVPLFLQWDMAWGYERYGSDLLALTGCGPTCLAMAGYYLTGDAQFIPDRVAVFAEQNGFYSWGNGSKWTLISQGSQMLGLNARELPLDEAAMVQALEDGQPIICVVGPGDFTTEGHFIVLTGLKNGQFTLNDPNSRRNSDRLWRYDVLAPQIQILWAISA